MSNKFCRHLSNGFKIDLNWDDTLLWSPCCYYTKKTPLLNTVEFKKALEYTSTATGWLPECRLCRQMEESRAGTALSPRQASFRRIPSELDVGVCGNLELSFDSTCNAACLSCGGYNSSTWKKYEYKHGIKDVGPIINRASGLTDQLIDAIPMDQLDEIYILGGEPFYSESGNKLLRHLHQNHCDISKVSLRYQTNGSIVPNDETRELWQGFRSIEICLSLDGVGERFNYLRWPLKWHRVERTALNLVETTNATVYVNATINPLNVFYFKELEDWVVKTIPINRLKFPDMPVRPNRCLGTLDLNKTPVELRNHIREVYGEPSPITKIFSNLEHGENYQPMIEYIETHDRLRRMDWKKTFPDVVKFFK